MKEYEDLIEALVGMAKITRPSLTLNMAKDNVLKSAAEKRSESIQHGICDLLEDAAVAIDDLLSKLKGVNNEEGRTHAEAA